MDPQESESMRTPDRLGGNPVASTPSTPCTPVTPSTPCTPVTPKAQSGAALLDADRSQDLKVVQLGLPGCDAGKFAVVADGVLSDGECRALIDHAAAAGRGYEAALLGVGGGQQALVQNVRRSERNIIDDEPTAEVLFSRVRSMLPPAVWAREHNPLVDRARTVEPSPAQVDAAASEGDPWRKFALLGLNPRLRYLRYSEGDFFERHRDGSYWTPGSEKRCSGDGSFLTIQFYLQEADRGGETGFLALEDGATDEDLAVAGKAGRVLIFEHSALHEGCRIENGTKVVIRTDVMYRRVMHHSPSVLQ